MTRVAAAAAALLAGCSSSTFTWEVHLGVTSNEYEVRVDGAALPAGADSPGFVYTRDYADRQQALAAPATAFDIYRNGAMLSQVTLSPACDDGATASCGDVVLERDSVVIEANGGLAPLASSASCYDGSADPCGGWVSGPPAP